MHESNILEPVTVPDTVSTEDMVRYEIERTRADLERHVSRIEDMINRHLARDRARQANRVTPGSSGTRAASGDHKGTGA